jgi:hypothetical protein
LQALLLPSIPFLTKKTAVGGSRLATYAELKKEPNMPQKFRRTSGNEQQNPNGSDNSNA